MTEKCSLCFNRGTIKCQNCIHIATDNFKQIPKDIYYCSNCDKISYVGGVCSLCGNKMQVK